MQHDGSESSTPTRRALLVGALGAAAAGAVAALGSPGTVHAADPNDVVLGSDANVATTTTKITNSGNTSTVFWAQSSSGIGLHGSTTSSTAVYGQSNSWFGVYASSGSGPAVGAVSTSNVGVQASSESASGISASTASLTAAAIVGQATSDAAGIQGVSGSSVTPAPVKTGVYGYAAQDAAAIGVKGETAAGRGVYGVATSGTGVRGQTGSGTAGYFAATNLLTGFALRAIGRVKLDKSAGIATIAVGTNSVVVTPGIDLVSTSAVVASLMGSAGGTTTVHRSVVNATTNTFTIYLTADNTAANPVKVAWHVFG